MYVTSGSLLTSPCSTSATLSTFYSVTASIIIQSAEVKARQEKQIGATAMSISNLLQYISCQECRKSPI